MTTSIYGLFCPIEKQIKYVGKSNNVERRLRDHMSDFRTEYSKGRWIRSLKHQKLRPEIVILEEVEMEKWQEMEQWWIEYLRFLGINLLNYNKGGNGLSVANHMSFKPGQKPWNKKEI